MAAGSGWPIMKGPKETDLPRKEGRRAGDCDQLTRGKRREKRGKKAAGRTPSLKIKQTTRRKEPQEDGRKR